MVRRGRKVIELVISESSSTNPSPSNDPYYDNPENIAELKKRIQGIEKGKASFTTVEKGDIKKLLGLE